MCFTTNLCIMWHFVSQLKLTAKDEKYPHVINVDKGNSEDHQQEESVEGSLEDSLEGNNPCDIYVIHLHTCICGLLLCFL